MAIDNETRKPTDVYDDQLVVEPGENGDDRTVIVRRHQELDLVDLGHLRPIEKTRLLRTEYYGQFLAQDQDARTGLVVGQPRILRFQIPTANLYAAFRFLRVETARVEQLCQEAITADREARRQAAIAQAVRSGPILQPGRAP